MKRQQPIVEPKLGIDQLSEGMPNSLEAEQSVLALILHYRAMSHVADLLQPNDFYRDAHREIYKVMMDLYKRHEGADYISVSSELKRKGVTIEDEVGGFHYLMGLDEAAVNNFLGADELEKHTKIVQDLALAREGLWACGQAANAFATMPASKALMLAEKAFFEIAARKTQSDFVPISDFVMDYVNQVTEKREQGGVITGIPTPFKDLTKLLKGLKDQKLYLLAARPAMGKTSFALTLAHSAAKEAHRNVGILSLEMGKEELLGRLAAIEAHIPVEDIEEGTLDDEQYNRFIDASGKLSSYPIYIDDSFGCSLAELQSKARRLHAKHGLDILFVDYLQLMSDDSDETENEVRMLTMISRGLKGLARELNIPIVALAQLNRNVESRQSKIPQLSDLRGSGSLEQDADVVMFLYRDEVYNAESERKGECDIIVPKHRGGKNGCVTIRFKADQTWFHDPDYAAERDYGQR